MSKLIDYLDSINLLSQKTLFDFLYRNNIKTIDSLVLYMRELIDEDYIVSEYNPFIFVPNSDISGTGGCDEISCKIARAEKFAVFSALYADKVYIQLAFITSEHYELIDMDEVEIDELMNENYKTEVLKEISLILVYAELIKNNIVFITPSHEMMCPACFQNQVFGNDIIKMEKIKKEYISKAKVILQNYDSNEKTAEICISNIHEFFPDHEMFWTITDEKVLDLLKNEKIGKKIRNNEYSNSFISGFIEDEILSAMYTTKYCNEQNAKLITNKMSDAMFLGSNKDSKKISEIKDYTNCLPEYDLLITQNLKLKNVIKLRQEESEAFNKYRIALNKAVIEQNKTNKVTDWYKIYDDIIYPELNNLDLRMKQIRNGRMSRLFGTMTVIGTALVASKFGDIIKPDLFSNIQAFETAVGAAGINFILDKTSTKKADLQNNDYFFLWKLKKTVKK
ncbi:hypothetical protein [[Clostridium] fimetarium]|uniref:Uncharacterized protein n=1 Tax=[Clostridium] fimetarium TaxID=99656 RepID=A0A1I0MX65_9FIRM|nr:hypothetical protein [[Clostridium] fimetarium]SEV93354.1 hypothetical protein SAMN05421659_102221 [[Clostridium] fimetarium]